MAQDKFLAEWFWTDRWMGSSGFLLPMLARGVYREMLTQAWRRGAKLPNDIAAVKRAIGATDVEWAEAWPLVSKYWRVDNTGCFVNDTQLEIYAQTVDLSLKRSKSGKLGSDSRWNGKSHGKRDGKVNGKSVATPITMPLANACPPSPSPSPSLISISVSKDHSHAREQPCEGSASFKGNGHGKPLNGTSHETVTRAVSKALAAKIATDEKVRRRAPRFR